MYRVFVCTWDSIVFHHHLILSVALAHLYRHTNTHAHIRWTLALHTKFMLALKHSHHLKAFVFHSTIRGCVYARAHHSKCSFNVYMHSNLATIINYAVGCCCCCCCFAFATPKLYTHVSYTEIWLEMCDKRSFSNGNKHLIRNIYHSSWIPFISILFAIQPSSFFPSLPLSLSLPLVPCSMVKMIIIAMHHISFERICHKTWKNSPCNKYTPFIMMIEWG